MNTEEHSNTHATLLAEVGRACSSRWEDAYESALLTPGLTVAYKRRWSSENIPQDGVHFHARVPFLRQGDGWSDGELEVQDDESLHVNVARIVGIRVCDDLAELMVDGDRASNDPFFSLLDGLKVLREWPSRLHVFLESFSVELADNGFDAVLSAKLAWVTDELVK